MISYLYHSLYVYKFRFPFNKTTIRLEKSNPKFRRFLSLLENTTKKYKYPRKFQKLDHFHLVVLKRVSKALHNMGLSSSKPFQIFLSDIFEKV